jgi:hypothetical protein
MEYFFKLKEKFTDLRVHTGSENVSYGIGEGKDFKGLKYFSVDSNTEKVALSIIPEEYRHHFGVAYLVINAEEVLPHTDSDIKVSINVYLKPSNFTTFFYKKKYDDLKVIKIKNQTDGSTFVYDDLIMQNNFIAKINDIWILDVSEIHSVRSLNLDKKETREMLVIQSSTMNFNSVYEMYRNYGKLSIGCFV